MLQRVAVIGAGAAGLCAARHILSRPHTFRSPVVYELSAQVGGTWCYEESNNTPVHSSMYRDLRTNLPKELMMFPDFPFDADLSSFLPHQDIQRYLEKYCHNYDIQPHVRFNTAVESVKPVVKETRTTWEVTSSSQSGCRETETFDSVFVCSGHYSDPYIPDIPGMEHFKGQVLHSHSYRFAEPYAGQSVVVLGAKASGLDISIELAKVGAKVTLSHGGPPLSFPLRDGISQSRSVAAVQPDGRIHFQDGSVCNADVFILCTGYRFSFGFLDGPSLGLTIDSHMVSPLWKYLLPPAFPSLVFISVCKMIVPFPVYHCQVQFALSVLEGSVPLPSQPQMESEVLTEQQEKLARGIEHRHLLIIQKEQFDYCRALAALAGFKPLTPATQSLYHEVWRQRGILPEDYRTINYKLISDQEWEVIN